MPCTICQKDITAKRHRLNIHGDEVCDPCWTDLVSEPLPANGREFAERLRELKFRKRLEG